jgi:lipid II:glycine glycyltransferase (peptidoglycan interpeptide bridge formation enzyme)
VFEKAGRKPTFTRPFLQQVHERLFAAGELLIVSAQHDLRRVALLILPHDGRTAMYWAGGAHAEAMDLAANNLLHWQAILECRRRGMARYDFISTKGGPGRFKKTFGPEVAEVCGHWEATRPSILRVAKEFYERRARRSQRL